MTKWIHAHMPAHMHVALALSPTHWMNRIVDRVIERFLDEVSERLA